MITFNRLILLYGDKVQIKLILKLQIWRRKNYKLPVICLMNKDIILHTVLMWLKMI